MCEQSLARGPTDKTLEDHPCVGILVVVVNGYFTTGLPVVLPLPFPDTRSGADKAKTDVTSDHPCWCCLLYTSDAADE